MISSLTPQNDRQSDLSPGARKGDQLVVARLEFRSKQAVGTLWQSVLVDVLDLAIIDGDARKQVGGLLGKALDRGPSICGQFVAFGLDPA
jgi:hypothetical protein